MVVGLRQLKDSCHMEDRRPYLYMSYTNHATSPELEFCDLEAMQADPS